MTIGDTIRELSEFLFFLNHALIVAESSLHSQVSTTARFLQESLEMLVLLIKPNAAVRTVRFNQMSEMASEKEKQSEIYRRISDEFLRQRSEHNDERGLAALEELALHQCHLTRIEYINRVCPNLRILFMQVSGNKTTGRPFCS